MKISFLISNAPGGIMKTLKSSLLILAALLLPALAAAAPLLINYQGRLVDTAGNPLAGPVNITFNIYNAASGGGLVWGPETQSVTPDNGIFNVSLGAVTPLTAAVFSVDTRYLEIQIGTDSPMAPRTRLLSTPYALYTANLGSSGTQALISTDTVMTASQLRLGNYAALPGSIGEGSVVYDSVGKQINFWNGTDWTALAAGGVSPWSSGSDKVILVDGNKNVGVGTGSPLYKLHVSSAAGEAGDILVVSTGSSNMFRVNGLGEVRAAKYYGDGSALTGIITTDKLLKAGDTMTGTLVMNTPSAFNTTTENSIVFSTNVSVDGQFRIGNFASAPDAAALGAGALYSSPAGALFVSNGTTWNPLASGGASPWTGGGTGSVSLVAGTDKVGVGKAPVEKLDVAGTIKSDFGVNASTMVISDTGANALDVAGGIKAGGVNIIGTDGRIPAVSGTYFASLNGSNLTNISGTQVDLSTVTAAINAGLSPVNAALSTAVYNNGNYSDPSWITSLATAKIDLSTVTTAINNTNSAALSPVNAALSTAVYNNGSYANPSWITSLATAKIDLSTVTIAINSGLSPVNAALSTAVYNNGSYSDPAWITSLSTSKIDLSTVAAVVGPVNAAISTAVYTVNTYNDPAWLASLATSKISLSTVTAAINAGLSPVNAALSTAVYNNGSYTDPSWIASLATSKISLSTVTAAINAGLSPVNAALSTAVYNNGSYTNPSWIASLATAKIDLSTVTSAIANANSFGSAANGPINFSTNVVLNAAQLRIGNFSAGSIPSAGMLGSGAIHYNSSDGTLYVSNGASWSPLASGGASPWSGGGTGTVSLVAPADKVSVVSPAGDSIKTVGGLIASSASIVGNITASSVTTTGDAEIRGLLKAGSGGVQLTDATGKIQAISGTYFASLSGANLTSLTAANIAAGTLGTSVVASSVPATNVGVGWLGAQVVASSLAVNSVYPGAIAAGAITATSIGAGTLGATVVASSVPAANIGVGKLGAQVVASSIAVNGVYTNAIADAAITDAKVNDVAGSKITGVGSIVADRIAAGTLGTSVVASSVPAANIGVGKLGAQVVASSLAVNSVYSGAIAAGAITATSIGAGTLGATVVASSVPATNVGVGWLGAQVVASSLAINSVYSGAIAAGAVTATSIGAGTLGATVVASSVPAANIGVGKLGAQVVASSIAVNSVQDNSIVGMSASKLAGNIPLSQVAGVAASTDTVALYRIGGVAASTDTIAMYRITGVAASTDVVAGVRITNFFSSTNTVPGSNVDFSTVAALGAANTFTSSQTITAAGGLGLTYGITAASASFTASGLEQYSVVTSSGVNIQAGPLTVNDSTSTLAGNAIMVGQGGLPRMMQSGSGVLTGGTASPSFPTPFRAGSTPIVVVTNTAAVNPLFVSVSNNTGFTVEDGAVAGTDTFNWIAIGEAP
jgi:hypothetical protein